MSRIRTTHTGSLPRPHDLEEMIVERDAGREPPGFEERVAAAVDDVVRRQTEAGIDLVNDGEQGKQSYSTYVQDRLTGFDGESLGFGDLPELHDHPDYGAHMGALMQSIHIKTPACTGPVRLKDPDAVGRDVERLLKAAEAAGVARERLFMSAASPGVIAFFFADQHYGDREAYLGDLAAAMRPEYEAIVEAGITLQLDCPDLAMARHLLFADRELEEFRREITLNVDGAQRGASATCPPSACACTSAGATTRGRTTATWRCPTSWTSCFAPGRTASRSRPAIPVTDMSGRRSRTSACPTAST